MSDQCFQHQLVDSDSNIQCLTSTSFNWIHENLQCLGGLDALKRRKPTWWACSSKGQPVNVKLLIWTGRSLSLSISKIDFSAFQAEKQNFKAQQTWTFSNLQTCAFKIFWKRSAFDRYAFFFFGWKKMQQQKNTASILIPLTLLSKDLPSSHPPFSNKNYPPFGQALKIGFGAPEGRLKIRVRVQGLVFKDWRFRFQHTKKKHQPPTCVQLFQPRPQHLFPTQLKTNPFFFSSSSSIHPSRFFIVCCCCFSSPEFCDLCQGFQSFHICKGIACSFQPSQGCLSDYNRARFSQNDRSWNKKNMGDIYGFEL